VQWKLRGSKLPIVIFARGVAYRLTVKMPGALCTCLIGIERLERWLARVCMALIYSNDVLQNTVGIFVSTGQVPIPYSAITLLEKLLVSSTDLHSKVFLS
jgi:hypothetical protein